MVTVAVWRWDGYHRRVVTSGRLAAREPGRFRLASGPGDTGSARFVLRPEFETIPETANKTESAERGSILGHLLDRERLPAGALAAGAGPGEPADQLPRCRPARD